MHLETQEPSCHFPLPLTVSGTMTLEALRALVMTCAAKGSESTLIPTHLVDRL